MKLKLNTLSALCAATAISLLSPSKSFAMTELTDAELSESYSPQALALFQNAAETMDPAHSQEITNAILLTNKKIFDSIFSYDYSIEGKDDRSTYVMKTYEGMTVIEITMNSYIAKITLANLRVRGAPQGSPTFGTLTLRDISITGTLTVSQHP